MTVDQCATLVVDLARDDVWFVVGSYGFGFVVGCLVRAL